MAGCLFVCAPLDISAAEVPGGNRSACTGVCVHVCVCVCACMCCAASLSPVLGPCRRAGGFFIAMDTSVRLAGGLAAYFLWGCMRQAS